MPWTKERRDQIRPHIRAVNKRWREQNKERVAQHRLAAREKVKNYLRQLKDVPCQDCGIKYPYYVMDFDHRDPETKEYAPARLCDSSMATVEKELAKCDVVCANCHRERTHKQRNQHQMAE